MSLSVGGRDGGGAVLTDFGRVLITAYRKLEAQTQGDAQASFGDIATGKRMPAAEPARRRPLARSGTPRRSRAREA